MQIRTIGDLRKLINDLDDDFTIDLRVRKHLTVEELKDMSYPYPWSTTHDCVLEFDDIGYSDKDFCIGVDVTYAIEDLKW